MANHPTFGAARRDDFLLAPGIAHLNHGSFGATAKAVLAEQQRWREIMEANPTGFFFDVLPQGLRTAAARLARAFGGAGEEWAFVENATAGVNAALASLAWQAGDEILVTSQVYNAVDLALRHHAGRHGAVIVPVPVPVPFEDPAALIAALERAVTPRTRLAVLDHITSAGATVLPVAGMVAALRAQGVPVLVDGAHAPGQVVLDVPAIGADWYVGNLHKWCFAAKGCAALWVAPARRAMLHPTVISHGYGAGFPAEFDFTGTRDATAWLSAGAALDYVEALDADAMRAHNDALAAAMAERLARAWGTGIAAVRGARAAMATVRLPRPGGADRAVARALTLELLHKHRIVAPVMPLDGACWLRISAQIYNEPADYDRLVEIGRTL